MQIYKVVVTESAEFEIDEYFDYIALDSVPNAINWHDKIYDKLETLSKMALRCPIAEIRNIDPPKPALSNPVK